MTCTLPFWVESCQDACVCRHSCAVSMSPVLPLGADAPVVMPPSGMTHQAYSWILVWTCLFLVANHRWLQADDGQPRLSRSADAEAVGLLNQRRSAHSPSRLEQQEQAQGQDSPEGLSHRPVHVHVIGHTQMPSQLHRQRQQQQQGHSMMPRVAHYHQSPSSMLQYQHYQPELGQSQQQPQGLMLGIHQYQQQHPDGLMQYQHQQGLSAMQQQHQMHGGVGELMGHGMGQQLQDRGQYYGHAEHDAASQPVLPGNYAQVSRCISVQCCTPGNCRYAFSASQCAPAFFRACALSCKMCA